MRTFLLSLSVFAATVFLGLGFLDEYAVAGNEKLETSVGAANNDGEQRAILPIELPADWRIDVEGKEFGGWRQTGVAPGALEDVVEEVGVIMEAHGFSEARRVADDELGNSRKLIQYSTRSGIKVLWMLWDIGRKKTGFSWGVEGSR